MDNLSAFAMGEATRKDQLMVFDWEKAAHMIVKRRAAKVSAGLARDWEWTGGPILKNHLPVPQDSTYVYLASTWATPEIEIDGELFDCFRLQKDSPGWDHDTYWPAEALAILNPEDN